MAPEIIKRSPYSGSAVDVWALGIMAYRMLTGTYPFMAQVDKELYKKIVTGSFETSTLPSEKARDLVSRMLRVCPEERIKASEVKEVKERSCRTTGWSGREKNNRSAPFLLNHLSLECINVFIISKVINVVND